MSDLDDLELEACRVTDEARVKGLAVIDSMIGRDHPRRGDFILEMDKALLVGLARSLASIASMRQRVEAEGSTLH